MSTETLTAAELTAAAYERLLAAEDAFTQAEAAAVAACAAARAARAARNEAARAAYAAEIAMTAGK